MTGGRVKPLEQFVGRKPFMLAYGDGFANFNLDKLLVFHKKNGMLVTVTAVIQKPVFVS